MAAITYEGDVQRFEQAATTLFGGQKLWFSLGVPARSRLMQEAEQNGAEIVKLEQQADVKLVDHAKFNQAPGTYSYKYVDLSIRNGVLEELESHRVGSTSRVDRPVGSIVTASKGGRNKFTDSEDQLLWNWVKPLMDTGGAWKGNEIYKQLERANPAHTFQSWRDRWIKHTQFQKRQITAQRQPHEQLDDQVEASPRSPKRRRLEPPTQGRQANIGIVHSRPKLSLEQVANPATMGNTESKAVFVQTGSNASDDKIDSSQQAADATGPERPRSEEPNETVVIKVEEDRQLALQADNSVRGSVTHAENSVSADGNRLPLAFDFTQDEARMLYKATPHILDALPDKLDESWTGVAQQWGHTKDTWRIFFNDFILPEYRKRHQIHTEEQLEAHVKAYVVSERARKESEREKERNKKRTVQSQYDGEGDVDAGGARLQKQRKSVEEDSLLQSERSGQFRVPPAANGHRPPQPNESRKLSQEKSSQSTSSQSRPRSISQQSQSSQPFAPIAETLTSEDKLYPQAEPSLQRPKRGYSATQLQKRPKPDQQPREDAVESTSQVLEEHESFSSQFVTQASHNSNSTSTANDVELQDIPYKDPTPSRSNSQHQSQLSGPKEQEYSTREPKANSNRDIDQKLPSSPPIVQLVERENEEPAGLHSSSYAPSEILSQGMQFETQIRLSQAWETAPDGLVDDGHTETNNEEHHYDNEVQPDLSQSTIIQGHESLIERLRKNVSASPDATRSTITTSTVSSNDSIQNKSTEDDFETAPMSLRTETTSSTTVPQRLDTQALFQQPTQVGFSELAAIPEPLEGWDDEMDGRDQRTPTAAGKNPAGDVDWTLPLPDPDIDEADVVRSVVKEGEPSDIENWLANQPTIHPSIPTLLLKPLSHRALQTTSMDLTLATSVLANMVQRFSKGKHPAHQSLEDIQRLPKRKRKDLVATIVEDLVPSEIRGCWTSQDDQALLGVNGREVKRVEDKHGEEGVRNRFAFLEMWHT